MTHFCSSLPIASAVEGAIIPLGILLIVAAIVFIKQYFRIQRERLWHETARLALEKGQPLPARTPDHPAEHPQSKSLGLAIGGLVQIGVGSAFYFFGPNHMPSFIGAMIAFIGIALLLSSMISLFLFRSKDNSSSKS